ncbi:DUF2779 domain-containing protein [Pseudogemmatithrix spongiicola]|uniref:DUF2779 domain-containing protein n=1 Tax=Pseudogemmatithrix spongiicola TaxID=3062599 RepID=A0AA49JS39_9BACT|nr:DUF2779 domain-containing protein [Gemmatimonadaceae bacterium 'strain 138']WKW13834.1 DUF2779 domain-containing protein [Gemmatimonadaceae bacterium 'strain 318']
MPRHTLSKSDFKTARGCGTKLYYRELKYPDTMQQNEYLQLLAEGGYMVELLAKQMFPTGLTLEYGKKPLEAAAQETAAQLERGAREEVVLFEATLFDGVRQARVDILKRTPRGFDLYEVKSSSIDFEKQAKALEKTGSLFKSQRTPFGIHSDWREYLEDVTYQVALLRDLYPDVPIRAHLMLMDKRAPVPHDGMPQWFRIVKADDGRLATAEFIGDAALARESRLVIAVDCTSEVEELEPGVREAAQDLAASLAPELTRIEPVLTRACRNCEFRTDPAEGPSGFHECWGERGTAHPHVLQLFRGGDLIDEMIAQGIDRVTDIPDAHVAALKGVYGERQRVQIEQTRLGKEWFDPALGHEIAQARYPLHFIDFEAARIAIPHHKGMTPYGLLAFQWSCHTQRAPGAELEHRHFLNTDPIWPNELFARELRDAVGHDGTLLVWSAFEKSILSAVAEEMSSLGSGDAELANWLREAALPLGDGVGRQLDMLKLCRKRYYHPGMQGSNSIKYVLDALWKHSSEARSRFAALAGREGDPELGPYATLPPEIIDGSEAEVKEGTGAVRAYFRMAYGLEREDPTIKSQWSNLLLEYCKLDTLAMVLIWEHWQRITGSAATGR